MSRDKRDIRSAPPAAADPVSFAERLAGSGVFTGLFQEGMGLLEETADYLDGPGREESRDLGRLGGLAYATESMKLTTRLMQLASWLLLRRSVNEGEMSTAQASEEMTKVRLEHPDDHQRSAGFDDLPAGLKDLIERSLRLQSRIRQLDRQLRGELEPAGTGDHPVNAQIDMLRNAFGRD